MRTMIFYSLKRFVFPSIQRIALVHPLWTQSATHSTCGMLKALVGESLGICVATSLSRTSSRMSSKTSSGCPPGPTLMAKMGHEPHGKHKYRNGEGELKTATEI